MNRVPAFAALFTVGLLYWADSPYFLVFLIWSLTLFYLTALERRRGPRILLFNVGLIALVLAGVEAGYRMAEVSERGTFAGVESGADVGLHHPHQYLSVAPLPGRYRAWRKIGEQALYEAHYTINEFGHRVTLPPVSEEAPAILFCGGSVTFGEGLEDEESFPHRVSERLGGAYRVCNLSFRGYGAQHLLSITEHELYREALGGSKPVALVYLAIPDHVRRAVGAVGWTQKHPRFVRRGDRLEREGTFKDGTLAERFRHFRLKQMGRSAWGRRQPYVADEDDVDFWLDMVIQARDEFQRTWPEAEFHVVLLDSPGPFTEMMKVGLKSRKLNSHFMFATMPDLLDAPFKIRLDGHPNAAGASRLADYMLNEVLAGLISDRTSTWRP